MLKRASINVDAIEQEKDILVNALNFDVDSAPLIDTAYHARENIVKKQQDILKLFKKCSLAFCNGKITNIG